MSVSWRVTFLRGFVCVVAYLASADVAVAQRMVPAIGITVATMGAITGWGVRFSLAFWSGACLLAALPWLTIPVHEAPMDVDAEAAPATSSRARPSSDGNAR